VTIERQLYIVSKAIVDLYADRGGVQGEDMERKCPKCNGKAEAPWLFKHEDGCIIALIEELSNTLFWQKDG
jgi:hypothetical protein